MLGTRHFLAPRSLVLFSYTDSILAASFFPRPLPHRSFSRRDLILRLNLRAMIIHDSWACERAVDNTFGPAVGSCARSFDFTLLFEQAILCLPQHAVFMLLVPWRLGRLRSSTVKARGHDWMSRAKLSATVLLIATQIVLLTFRYQPKAIHTRASIPAAVISLSAAIVVAPLSYLEHHRSVRPSTLLSSYLSLSIILDLPQVRTMYLIPGGLRIAVVLSVALGVKSALLLLEERDKTHCLMKPYQTLPTEATSGILSRSLFLWMNGLFQRGYRKVMSFEDLGPIDDRLASSSLHQHLQEAWHTQKRQHAPLPLLRSLWIALRWPLLSPVPPRLCYCGFLFAQPFLIERATLYVSQRGDAAANIDVGYGLIGATACIYLGIAVRAIVPRSNLAPKLIDILSSSPRHCLSTNCIDTSQWFGGRWSR